MKKIPGKIVLVDDQEYERTLLEEVLLEKEWNTTIEYFPRAEEALRYLKETDDKIFLIISDINMPGMNGLEFKKIIDQHDELSRKAIPFIFVSTAATQDEVTEAYGYRVQGYFQKPKSVEAQADMLDIIIQYWIVNQHPQLSGISAT